MNRPVYELAEIISRYKASFTEKHHPLKQHLSVLNALQQCRTAALGGHVDECDSCGHIRISYNSCRNRHCPKCQNTNREKWIEAQHANLLPASYFHVVFTLPPELNNYCLKYPKDMYNLLFQASKETIMTFAHDPKHLGATPGIISVLHTWGQNLSLHPHVHMTLCRVVALPRPATGSTPKARENICFPKKPSALSLKVSSGQGFLSLLQNNEQPLNTAIRKSLYRKKWIVYAKCPFAGPQQVIEYLGRYTHKIAISNHRIKNIENGKVTFSYKDYAHGSVQKEMTLEAEEFLRRFCLHILPKGFMKIRHYGFLSSRARPELKEQQRQMGIVPQPQKQKDWKTIAKEKLDFDVEMCPCCKTGRMITLLSFDAHGPPLYLLKKVNKQQLSKQ